MRLTFKKISKAPFMFVLGICTFFLPFLFIIGTKVIEQKQYVWLIYFEFLILFAILFLWYKIYYEIVYARIENNVLYYRRLLFIQKSIKIEDIKGFKVGNEDYDF